MWLQGRRRRGARSLRDLADDSAAGSTSDFRLNLPNAEIRGGGQRLDLVDNVLLCSGTSAALIPAVTRSLMSDDSSSAMAPMMVNIARPMGLSVSI